MATRSERSVWALAGGAGCAFTLAAITSGQDWRIGFTATALTVAIWSWTGTVLTGAAIGGIGWLCVTGFDVNTLGNLHYAGAGDIARAAVLVALGAGAAFTRAGISAAGRYHYADPLWAEFEETLAERGEFPAPPR